jgi:hypothetical protein
MKIYLFLLLSISSFRSQKVSGNEAGDAEETGDHSHTKDMRGDQTQDVAFEVIQSGLNLPWQ